MSSSSSPLADFSAWRGLRARYQRGMLNWLRSDDPRAGLREMQGVLQELTVMPHAGAAFWQAAQSLLGALADGSLPAEDDARRLCSRIDRQLRALEQGERAIDQALIQDTFGFVSSSLMLETAAPASAGEGLTPAEAAEVAATAFEAIEAAGTMGHADEVEYVREPDGEEAPAAASAEIPNIAGVFEQERTFDPVLQARWEAAGRAVGEAWSARQAQGAAPFRSAVIALCGAAVELELADALRLAEALATVADRCDDPQALADPRLVAAVAASVEVLVEPGAIARQVFAQRVDHLAYRLITCLNEAPVSEGRLIVSRTLYQIFVGEAHETLGLLHDELEKLTPDLGEMAGLTGSLADNAATIELESIRQLAMQLGTVLRVYHGHDLPAELRDTLSDSVVTLTQMVDEVAAGAIPAADETRLRELRQWVE